MSATERDYEPNTFRPNNSQLDQSESDWLEAGRLITMTESV